MPHAEPAVADGGAARAELYARLPLLVSDRWWLDLAAGAPGERVLELGAGAGRLSCALAAAGSRVTAIERDPAMADRLRRRVTASGYRGDVEVVQGDAAQVASALAAARVPAERSNREAGHDLVLLASSLLNEVEDVQARRGLLATAARACRPEGQVALQVLGPWWLTGMPERSAGDLAPLDGGPTISVDIERRGFDVRSGRRQARLTYRFPDGGELVDELDAGVITPTELDLLLDEVGLEPVGRWGARPPDPVAETDPVWHVLARPA